MVPVERSAVSMSGNRGSRALGRDWGVVLRPHFEERMPTKFVVDAFIDKQMKLCAYMPCNTPRYDAAACDHVASQHCGTCEDEG